MGKKKMRRGLKIFCIIVAVIAALLAAVVAINLLLNRHFTVSFYEIRSEKVSDNIRIVELADLHNAEYGKDNCELVSKIKALKPDLIVYAGDMMNYENDDYSVLYTLTDQLTEIAPIYACFGNNELDQYLFRDQNFKDEIEQHGVTLLSNEAMEITVKNTNIQLIAVTEGVEQFDVETNNSKKFVESLEQTHNLRVCLTHYPELFLQKLLGYDIDVAFTGHAHGGMIRLPYVGGLYSNGEGFLPKFTAGVEEAEDGTKVVVSRGLGSHGGVPRINNQPELVVVDICWY